MRILTMNCFTPPTSKYQFSRLKKIASEIVYENIEVICLQEVATVFHAKYLRDIFQKQNYNTYCKCLRLINQGGLFFATTLPIFSSKFIPFQDQGKFFSLQITDRLINKGVQIVEILTPQKIKIANTHLLCPYNHDSDYLDKHLENNLNQVINVINSEKIDVLCGDFNFSTKSSLYTQLLSQTGLKDNGENSLITIDKNNTHRTGFYKSNSSFRYDYVFSNKMLKRVELFGDEKYLINNKSMHLSDHFGLVAKY